MCAVVGKFGGGGKGLVGGVGARGHPQQRNDRAAIAAVLRGFNEPLGIPECIQQADGCRTLRRVIVQIEQ